MIKRNVYSEYIYNSSKKKRRFSSYIF